MNELDRVLSEWNLVLEDDFQEYDPGPFSAGYTAFEEFYYPQSIFYQGPWQEISSYHLWGESHNPDPPNWKILERNGQKILEQTFNNKLNRKNWKYPIKKLLFPSRLPKLLAQPALATGDRNWRNYCVCAELSPQDGSDISGIFFRMQDAQCYYLLCFNRGRIKFLRRHRNEMKSLKSCRFKVSADRYYQLTVIAVDHEFSAFINGVPVLSVSDGIYQSGKVGLVGNVPTRHKRFKIYLDPLESAVDLEKPTSGGQGVNSRKYPAMTLWKKIKIGNRHSGRTLRFGDVTGDGQIDIVMAQGTPMIKGNDCNALTSISALDLEGRELWSVGDITNEQLCLSSDLPLQIYDIDGDGRNEIICIRDFKIQIIDGANGEVKKSVPTPKAVVPFDSFHQMLGDCIYICNLNGKKRPSDLLIKDRYSTIWAYNQNLELMWKYTSGKEMGHFPFAIDFNEDGKDEILVGYSLLGADGKKIWELPLSDHADAVSIIRNPDSNQLMVLIAASDEGFVFADINGKIVKQLRIGHMQTISVGRFIPERRDYCIATNTYWGSPGIIYILDFNGNIIRTFQPSLYGSPLNPVRWTGAFEDLILLSAAPDITGGLYNGLGEQVVTFPDDGHPTLCYSAFDLDGSGLDELLCWDHEWMWVYRQSKAIDSKRLVSQDLHPAVYNDSNYRSNILVDNRL